eukprot:10121283-Alexandrium_andersonii.AAC.1
MFAYARVSRSISRVFGGQASRIIPAIVGIGGGARWRPGSHAREQFWPGHGWLPLLGAASL